MASFTVRMVLEDASWEDYEKLHARMEMSGFSRTVTADDGNTYHLPDAEYDYQGQVTCSQVFEKAKVAANGVGRKFSILVTESKGRIWVGLERA